MVKKELEFEEVDSMLLIFEKFVFCYCEVEVVCLEMILGEDGILSVLIAVQEKDEV